MNTEYDAIVIGTGQAGPSLAAKLAGEGLNTAIIERKLFGGTCVNTGCTPTKALVASARAAYMARRAGDFGVEIDGSVTMDMKKVKNRKDEIVKQSTEGVEKWLKNLDNLTVYEGHARFTGPKNLEVNGDQLEADKIFINVGGRANVPEGLRDLDYLTNSTIMDLDVLPEHLVIVGGSYIGLEFGQMYRRFGSRVTIIERGSRLIKKEDEDVSRAILEILENEGIEVRLNADCIKGEKLGNEFVLEVDCPSGDREVRGSHLLVASGRRPNTDDLGLEKAGIEMDKRGFIGVDDQLHTNVEGIWALGDCNGKGAFTHTAYNDFEIVASELFENKARSVNDRILCYALYIDPPLGRVGMTERQVRESGREALIGARPMERIARAREKGETRGFMKVLIDKESKEILGAAILGTGGDEIIHSIIDIMYAGAPYTTIMNAVHIHPTVSELIPTMLEGLEELQ